MIFNKDKNLDISAIILLTDDKKEIRYFLMGVTDKDGNCTAGYIFDYVGGGDWQEEFVLNGKIVYHDNEEEENEIKENMMEVCKGGDIIGALDKLMDKMFISTEEYGYAPRPGLVPEELDGKAFMLDGPIHPIEFGNTIWST